MIETVSFWNHGHVRSGIDKECENAPWPRVDCSVDRKGSLKLAMEGSDVQSAAQETVAIKFEDNQAKGQPNQLKTEYDPVGGWVRGG